jgi:hypothetical protein
MLACCPPKKSVAGFYHRAAGRTMRDNAGVIPAGQGRTAEISLQ